MNTSKKIGIVAGSFDPVTKGHLWLIKEAYELLDEVYVVVATNPKKKHLFSEEIRKKFLHESLIETLGENYSDRLKIVDLGNRLVVKYAMEIGARYLLRGIRNGTDFDYEQQIQSINRKICPNVDTLYLFPPVEMTEISSSMVKGLVGVDGWEEIVQQYVSQSVFNHFLWSST